MPKIKIMPESLANKIAAGEVVERPASVVKELLENSLDAGTHKIDIETEAGGKRLIRLVDDGEGMNRDDAITAFERHATSKLHSAGDLESISTLGFRGEALPSIASVSRMFLRTSTPGDREGTEVEFNGGKLVAVREIAWPGGTEVEIRDLFFNVPARRKFLKSDGTESFHITNLVQHYALANPAAAFLLIRDGREVIRASPAFSLRERAYQVLGSALLDKLNEVSVETDGVGVHGLVSNPQEQRSSRDAQYFFVNGRFVRDQLIARAVSEAYRSMMPAGTYPAAILFIDLPPAEVDVNVHPAKTEVRFLHEATMIGIVRDAITRAIEASRTVTRLPVPPIPRAGHRTETFATEWGRQSSVNEGDRSELKSLDSPMGGLHRVNPAGEPATPGVAGFPGNAAPAENEFRLESPAPEPTSDRQPPLTLSFSDTGRGTTEGPNASGQASGFTVPGASTDLSRLLAEHFVDEGSEGPGCADAGVVRQATEPATLPGLGHGIKPMGQIRDSYIVATDDEGLLLIDQHVAHERVLFEQFRDRHLARNRESQPMLVPPTIDLSPAESEAFTLVHQELAAMGIETAELSGRTIAIQATPAGLNPGEAVAVVREVLSAVERERRNQTLDLIRDEIAASMACKAAIKVNMPLTGEKMQWLIDELMKTHNPMTCPHGRPIMMRFGLREIERGFKRP
ncbi:MAG TPA: DNA mismatch repair endonuclease MutL [Blastocatellia bacterium]|nr:DNA mismatch repair endonuclease MutL [Blastocatellia bacterium]